jgi:hypothetical protein
MSALPEVAGVSWRPLASESSLKRRGWLWTAITAAHVLPFLAVAALLLDLKPLLAPVALIAVVHAWAIPELYAARGAKVLRAPRREGRSGEPERTAMGLLGDLLDNGPRTLLTRTGLVLEEGRLGAWVVGQAGAVLVRPGGHRVYCYCVRATDRELPPGDRIAHLLLALRADETGFVTLANLSFSGARWRLRRRVGGAERVALAAATQIARRRPPVRAEGAPASATL